MPESSQNTILVAMDFSPCSQDAADLAAHLAQAHDALIVFVYVIEFPTRFFTAVEQDEYEAIALSRVAREFEHLQKEFEEMGLETGYEVIRGRPYAGILAAARHYNPRFLVMGLRGQQMDHDHFAGVNTLRVIRHANVPVVVVRDLESFETLDQLLVLVHPRKGMDRIHCFLEEFSGVLASTVNLVAPIDPERYQADEVMAQLQEEGRRIQEAGYGDIRCTVIEDSMTSVAILGFISDHLRDLDMVLVETSLTGTLVDMGQGSVVEDLLKLSPLPVMVASPESTVDESWVKEGDFFR